MILSVEGLTSGYGGSMVLKGLSLEVAEGEVVGLLGRNGMGKTTFMKTLMGLLPAAGGRIAFRGQDITRRKPYEIARMGLAYVPQGREVFADFTVAENLRLSLLGQPDSPGALPEILFQHFPILAERATQRAGTLSGGQQQQLAIARALASAPSLLLLDEPSEGIQPSIVEEITVSLKAIAAEQGLTILLVEQNLQMVFDSTSRCAFIENGRVAELQPTAVLRSDDSLLHRYLAI